jgi:hypothetical protein
MGQQMSIDPREADVTGAHDLGVARRSSDRVRSV